MSKVKLSKPISWKDEPTSAGLALLRDLQGNILKGHGRKHMTVLFLRFADARAGGDTIKAIRPRITTALQQLIATDRYRPGSVADSEPFLSLCLSHSGYQLLKANPGRCPDDRAFRDGLWARSGNGALGSTDAWNPHFKEEIHAAVIIAAGDVPGDRSDLGFEELRLHKPLPRGAAVVGRESGSVLLAGGGYSGGYSIEPFGYRDGLSQPLMLREELKDRATSPYKQEAPLETALVPCPSGGPDSYGSYFIFEKLEQHVAKFNMAITTAPAGEDAAGANLVGRFRDGTPLALSDRPVGPLPASIEFDYEHDKGGNACPINAHVRVVNNRSDSPRFPRRGMPYGYGESSGAYGPPVANTEVGLLFMCYNSNIANQFEAVQREMVTRDRMFNDFVTSHGGAYFFVPSISGLRNIAAGVV